MSAPKARSGILQLTPYQQGQSEIEGEPAPIKLSSNESSYGPSPAAVEAFHACATSLHRYPDGSQQLLRGAIAEVHGLDAKRIVCGNGSDELIQLVVRTYINDGDEALLSENGFVMSGIHAAAQGATIVTAPEQNYRIDVDAMLARVTDKTRFCTVANPNNPTGTYIEEASLRRLHAGLPEDCVFLIDDAYAEYVTASDYGGGLSMVDEFDNVVVTRTFSKIYGLPSLRIGWMYCSPDMVQMVQRIRTPFNTNSAALAAAAAAVRDTAHIEYVRSENAKWLATVTRELTALGIEVVPSQANFYLLRFSKESGKDGGAAAQFLQSRNIIPRPAGGTDEFLRITVGTAKENEAVLDALREYMRA